jgi:UDP-glucose 4-epimerase
MRALVTGCAGFIGSHLTESLLREGWEVVGVDCFNENYGRAAKLRNLEQARDWTGFDFVPVDLSRGAVADLVEDCDTIFHLAAEPGVRASWGQRFDNYLRNNVLATQHLLEALRGNDGKRFVYTSSSSIYGQAESLPTPEDVRPQPHSPYGMTKLAAEHLCSLYHANYGVQTTCLRYFTVYGPRQRPDMAFHIFCAAALRGEPINVFGDGRQTRDFTFVADVVNATRAAATAPEAPGMAFNIGGGTRVSLVEAIELIGEFAGRPVEVVRLPRQDGDVRDTGADTRRAQALLGFAPSVPFEEGLHREFQWMVEHSERTSGALGRSGQP